MYFECFVMLHFLDPSSGYLASIRAQVDTWEVEQALRLSQMVQRPIYAFKFYRRGAPRGDYEESPTYFMKGRLATIESTGEQFVIFNHGAIKHQVVALPFNQDDVMLEDEQR